jgi:hypothetical protein
LQSISKQEYLADLQARNHHNRQIIETVFLPLNQAQRSFQPEPNEWSIDQCFQHLITSFKWLSPHFIPALKKPDSANSDGAFRPSWIAKRFMTKQFDTQEKTKTADRSEKAIYSPDILTDWLRQNEKLSAMIEQASQADLQTKCWIIKWLPIRYNLGDYLRFFVSHDELHIDQSQRALQSYEQQSLSSTNT